MPSAKDKTMRAEMVLQAREVEKRKASEHGTWLPLSVWDKRGYDVQKIKDLTEPQDRKHHPVLGEIFRLWEQTEENSHEKALAKLQTMRKRKATEAPREPDSSDSSSSSSRKKSKKSKKAKKAKKNKKEKKDKAEAWNQVFAIGSDG